MIPYLEGFSKRMELVACIASVLCRHRNREIEKPFEKNELDNIIFSVLIHIMERTLTDDSKCTLDDIESFLSDILPLYHKALPPEMLRELTRYIIKDVLQNKGEGFSFDIMDYADGKMKKQPVRLIKDIIDDDDDICYVLEKQGFDMLFRSKEVDDELGFQMEEIRLEKLIKKGNYSDASAQSSALIRMLNEKRSELTLFERRLRNDLKSTSGEEYDSMIRSIHAMLNDEYETMQEIRKTLHKASKQLTEQIEYTEKQSAEVSEARLHIFQIEKNVELILQKQRELLTQSQYLGKVYQRILRESMLVHRTHTYDMEKTLLQPLEHYDSTNIHDIADIFAMLMNPLTLPAIPHTLSIGLFYDSQENRESVEGDDADEQDDWEDNTSHEDYINRRNMSHTETIRLLLQYAAKQPIFLLSEFWEYCCSDSDIALLTEEKRFFMVMLNLYELACIDIDAWRSAKHTDTACQGEFDLSWCIEKIAEENDNLYGIHKIHIRKGSGTTICETGHCQKTIEISNMSFETEG